MPSAVQRGEAQLHIEDAFDDELTARRESRSIVFRLIDFARANGYTALRAPAKPDGEWIWDQWENCRILICYISAPHHENFDKFVARVDTIASKDAEITA